MSLCKGKRLGGRDAGMVVPDWVIRRVDQRIEDVAHQGFVMESLRINFRVRGNLYRLGIFQLMKSYNRVMI